MVEALIDATDLHKSFGDTHAVNGVSLRVAPGEAYGLVGPDGAGKTTTLRLLVGALTPDRGQATVGGFDLRTHAEQARAEIGYLAQRFSLYADLTVLENLQFFGEVRGVSGGAFNARAKELLSFVGLTGFEDRLAGVLSGGMKQKLGLACALIHQPKVLLLDEPTGGVDPITRQDFWQLIIRLLAGGVAVIVSTPYMDEAARCNRLGFMHSGKILTAGSPRELTAPLHNRVLELVATPKEAARAACQTADGVQDVLTFGDRLHLRVTDAARVAATLPDALQAADVQVVRLRPIVPTLEDVFISLLEQAGAA